jgi:hypothetical protein
VTVGSPEPAEPGLIRDLAALRSRAHWEEPATFRDLEGLLGLPAVTAQADESAPIVDRVDALRRVLEQAIPTIRSSRIDRSYSYAAAVLVRLHPDACFPDGRRRPVEGPDGLWKTIDANWGIGDKLSSNSSFKRQYVPAVYEALAATLMAYRGGDDHSKQLSVRPLIAWAARRSHIPYAQLAARVDDLLRWSGSSDTALQPQLPAEKPHRVLTEHIRTYYADDTSGGPLRFATVELPSQRIPLSILTSHDWIDIGIDLTQDERSELLSDVDAAIERGLPVGPALRRIAECEQRCCSMIDAPVYRLLDVDIEQGGQLKTTYGLSSYFEYALTLDLLERELAEAVSSGDRRMPLRDRYLPSLSVIANVKARLCVGGPLALFAAARTAGRGWRGEPDYVLLIQQRSDRVLNAQNSLAVIPKAFHQPLVEPAMETPLLRTLEREIEEELMNRSDLDPTSTDWAPSIDPMHADRLTDAMRWLMNHRETGACRIEATGFGYNAMSGNFELPSLVVVQDERWWAQFAGTLAPCWETSGMLRMSSLDTAGIASLLCDSRWSNEGLFALALALRRLAQVDPTRTRIPPIDMAV